MANFVDRFRDTVPGETERIAAVWTKWRRLAAAAIVGGAPMYGVDAGAGDVYLRAGMGLDRPSETVFADRDCSSASPAALYGCGRGGDGARLRSVGDFGTVHALELGLGYTAAPGLRLEALAEYRPNLTFEGRRQFPRTRTPAIGGRGDVVAVHHAGGLCRPARADSTEDRPDRTLSWGWRRRRPHSNRRNPHDLSGDNDRRAGREPYRLRLEADGRGRGGSG